MLQWIYDLLDRLQIWWYNKDKREPDPLEKFERWDDSK